ncbi:MAG: O-antigen ligase family protein [Pseudothermotoga sp.]|nr:O-antigen ligase family protein [Pseudothermotoga sp.]
MIFLVVYVFLSGFVFVEPSPAEIWFLVSVPFLLIGFKTTFQSLLTFGLLFLPMLISTYVGYAVSGYYNSRFVVIDVYLFSFFLVIFSYFNGSAKKERTLRENFLHALMRAWSFAGLINIFAGLLVYMTGIRLPVNIIRFGIRLQGFFKDPNVLGPFLVPVALYYLKEYLEKGKKQLSNLLMFFLLSLGVVFTFSRAAWLNYVSTFLFYLFYALFNKKTLISTLFTVVMIILALSLFLYLSNYIYIFNTNLRDFLLARARLQSYDEARFETQAMFLDILSSTSILFGVGPGNYESFTGMATHSLYTRYIAERGLFGFATFLVFLGIVFRKVAKSEFKAFLIPVLVGQLVNSLFIDSLHWRHFWILLAFSCF